MHIPSGHPWTCKIARFMIYQRLTRNTLVFLAFSFFTSVIFANNLSISNISLASQNTTDDYYLVQFDVGWDNSWRMSAGPSNWDAAWLFVKFLNPDNGLWVHATLNYVDGTAGNDGHTEDSGSTITTPPDGKGVFVYRNTDGSGSNAWTVQLRWNYGVDGLGDDDPITIKVFGIEMVYIPEGPFYVGDGSGDAGRYNLTLINTADASVPVVEGAGGYPEGIDQNNAEFPNGYNAFYMMKYELSEQQWVSFFNTLTTNQQPNWDMTSNNGKNSDDVVNRNTVSWAGVGSEATTAAPNRACGYISQHDCRAYLDWAALRPITDMEFEKAGRGPVPPLPNEYAWGTANVYDTAYTIVNDGQANALLSNPTTVPTRGNASYNTTDGSNNGPLRCGIFAASTNADRTHSGGSYYGAMEMSGNLWDPVASADYVKEYTGIHGDGFLDTNGYGGEANWPNGYYDWNGKGGSYNDAKNNMELSRHLNYYNWTSRGATNTIRGVRTDPQ